MKRIILILFVSMFVTSVHAQSEWVKTVSEKSRVSFEMPGKVSLRNQDTDNISSEVFSMKDAVNVFGVVASDFTKMGLNFTYSDPSQYYEEMKSGSLVSSDAILISEKSVAYQKMLGKEISYTQMVGKHEYTYYKRFFFRGNFIYQFAIGGPSRMKNILLDKKNLYFNSIHFLEEKLQE